MRIVLVGLPKERDRLRLTLAANSQIDIVGESATIDEARAGGFDADAFVLVAPDTAPSQPPDRPEILEPLTRREIDVLQLVAEGLPNKTIAARLSISDQTVKFHVASICGKLGAHNRTEAVRIAMRRGLVTL